MKTVLKKLASLRLTMFGIAALIVNSVAISQWPDEALPWIVLPLSLLAINLFAALLVRQAFRHQSALLLFHVGLLAVLLLVAAGVLLRFDGSVELVEGETFDAGAVTARGSGWLHSGRLQRVRFEQGPMEVRYLAQLQRDTTHSRVVVTTEDGQEVRRDVGDRQGFTLHGYRFMTTFNKGFSVLMLWRDEQGRESLGAVNFPSYPKYDWNQVNDWSTPAGEMLTLELVLADRVPEDGPWTLESRDTDFTISLDDGREPARILRPGQSIAVKGGEITPLDVRLWMGYRIDYNPLLPWLITAAFLSLGALAVHVVQKSSAPRVTDAVTSRAGEQAA